MHLVKMITNDDGDKNLSNDWHYVMDIDAHRTLCTGEVFGFGESGAEYKEKFTGKITCPDCIAIIKQLKSVKL